MSYLPKSDTSPAGSVMLVTPSDTVDLKDDGLPCRGIAITVAGDLEIVDLSGATVVIPSGSLAVGILHPIFATRIKDSNTTATGIVAYF
jgi:hypothetical protein